MENNIKKTSVRTYLTLAICLFILQAYAKPENPSMMEKRNSATFTGRVTIDGKIADSIKLVVLRKFVSGNIGARAFYAELNKSGDFLLKIDSVERIQRVDFYFYGKTRQLLMDQYIEPGDDIVVNVESSSRSMKALFTGDGAAKYNYGVEVKNFGSFEEFLKIENVAGFKVERDVYNLKNVKASMNRAKYTSDRYQSVFEHYRSSMSLQMQQLIQSNIALIKSGALIHSITGNYFNSTERDSILTYYMANTELLTDTSCSATKSLNRYFIDDLYSRSKLELSLQSGTQENPISETYNYLKRKFKGELRDQIMLRYLIRKPPGDPSEYETALTDVISYMQKSLARIIAVQLLQSLRKGAEGYNFSLPGTDGKMVRLSDFKGDVVLLDVWFTGCMPCMEIAKTLREDVIPYFSKNKRVKFISVNVDKSESLWKRGISTGLYTDPTTINLFTKGERFNNDFIQYYNITACPTLLLFASNGKIASAYPERDGKKLIEIIESEVRK